MNYKYVLTKLHITMAKIRVQAMGLLLLALKIILLFSVLLRILPTIEMNFSSLWNFATQRSLKWSIFKILLMTFCM